MAKLRPKAPDHWEDKDVGFVSPGHCPGCEQEEAAAHPGRPHPGEWPGRAVGPVTLVPLCPREGGGGARPADVALVPLCSRRFAAPSLRNSSLLGR